MRDNYGQIVILGITAHHTSYDSTQKTEANIQEYAKTVQARPIITIKHHGRTCRGLGRAKPLP